MKDKRADEHEGVDAAQEDTEAILSRRAFLIKSGLASAGLAGAGLAVSGCGEKRPQTCLRSQPCLSQPPPPRDAAPRPCLEVVQRPDAGAPRPCLKVKPPVPQPCLQPQPQPQPCLKVKPQPCLTM